MAAAAASAPCYVFFGWLADTVARKCVIWCVMALGMLPFYPGFILLSEGANPALVAASHRTPVVVVADPADCSSQFDPTGKLKFVPSCDIAKSSLANSGIAYTNQAAPAGGVAG